MKFRHMLVCFSTLVPVLFAVKVAHGVEVRVAVAANFATIAEEVGAKFTRQTGHRVLFSSQSSGKIFALVKSGAPFDIFLSAEQEHVRLLVESGWAVAESRFTYAIGKLCLLSQKVDLGKDGEVLRGGVFKRLAIANPDVAPYGRAAKEVLHKMGLWQRLRPRLVFGENVAQTFQFVATGNAELGFVALSQLARPEDISKAWVVPQEYYAPLLQDAVLLRAGKDQPAAREFLKFLRTDAVALSLIKDHGYGLP